MLDYPIALWSLNLGFAPSSMTDFAAHIEAKMAVAREEGARLLMLPEYAIEAALAHKPAGTNPTDEIAFLADAGVELVELLQPLPEKYGVSLLAGSMPVAAGSGFTNTAVLLTADGREIRQDKLSLTPGETDPESWALSGGGKLAVFQLDGLKVAILICLDVEMPALSCLLAQEQPELVLVPSMTETLAGYNRVYGCSKARAVELMSAVAVCGTVGASGGSTQNLTNVSGAALYVPCEAELGFDGVAAELPPTNGESSEDVFLVARVPVETLRKLRSGEADVWPGAWSGRHISVQKFD